MTIRPMTGRASIGAHSGVAVAPAYAVGVARFARISIVMPAVAVGATGAYTGVVEVGRVPVWILMAHLARGGSPVGSMTPRSFPRVAGDTRGGYLFMVCAVMRPRVISEIV